jgi:hypothetical protein
LIKLGMFVNIENAPVLIEPSTATAFSLSEVVLSLSDGSRHERHRCAVSIIDYDNNALSVQPVPVVEVDRFGRLAFGEDQ